ncbi:hypothetical protein M8J76_001198 [Diaphorina citri]|nr:hypothetical protein M8J76_001198 [Diaphorina citri]
MPPRKAERRPSPDASGGVRYRNHNLPPPNTQGLQESVWTRQSQISVLQRQSKPRRHFRQHAAQLINLSDAKRKQLRSADFTLLFPMLISDCIHSEL